jgi:hypothetical protein
MMVMRSVAYMVTIMIRNFCSLVALIEEPSLVFRSAGMVNNACEASRLQPLNSRIFNLSGYRNHVRKKAALEAAPVSIPIT